MSTISCRRFLKAIIFLSIVLPLLSVAQVKIKEKVEVNPGQPKTKSNADLPPFNHTNTVELPFSGEVTVQSLVYAPYESHQFLKMNGQIVLDDLQLTSFMYLGPYSGGTHLSFEILVIDTTATGEVVNQTIPITAVQPLDYPSECNSAEAFELGTFGIDGDGNEFFFSYDLIVTVGRSTPGGPPVKLVAWDSYWYFGFDQLVTSQLQNKCGYSMGAPGITLKVEIISGAEWGDLVDAAGRSVKTIDTLQQGNGTFVFTFRAWEKEPRQEQQVVVRLTTSDNQFTTNVNVFVEPYPYPLSVTPGRMQIQPGDTTKLDIQMMNSDGTPSNGELVSSTFTIVQGDTLAYLYSADSTVIGTSITGVFPTARLFVPSRPTLPDSFDVVVQIHAEEPCPDCQDASIFIPAHPEGSNRAPGTALPASQESDKELNAPVSPQLTVPPRSGSEFVGQRAIAKRDSIIAAIKKRNSDETRMKIERKVPAPSRVGNPNAPLSRVTPPAVQSVIGHWGLVRVTVKKETMCAQVIVTPAQLVVGDTASLRFKDSNGNFFPDSQVFDVFIQEGGDTVGTLHSSSGNGSLLKKVQTPISYIAPSTLNGSTTVHIGAVAYGSLSGNGNASAAQAKPVTSLAKAPGQFSGQSSNREPEQAQIAQLLRKLADSQCFLPTPLPLSPFKLASTIKLEVDPIPVHSPGIATLKVTLSDKHGLPIDENQSDVTVTYKLGNEVRDFGGLGSDLGPLSLNASYAEAHAPHIKASLGRKSYDRKFPFLISVSATATPPGSAFDEISLVGPHTTGVHFRQTDKRWSGQIYDHSKTDSIGNSGCALTCMAMVAKALGADTDPGRLNDTMKGLGKFGFSSQGGVVFGAIKSFGGAMRNLDISSTGNSFRRKTIKSATPIDDQNATLNKMLADGCVIIAQVKNPYHGSQPPGPDSKVTPHWVLITGAVGDTYSILDPADPEGSTMERHTTLAAYDGKVYAVRAYKIGN